MCRSFMQAGRQRVLLVERGRERERGRRKNRMRACVQERERTQVYNLKLTKNNHKNNAHITMYCKFKKTLFYVHHTV